MAQHDTFAPASMAPAQVRPRWRTGRGAGRLTKALVGASFILVLATPAMAGAAGAQAPPTDPCRYEGGTTDDQGEPLYHGVDPSRRTTLLRPFALARYPCPRSVEYRAVLLEVGRLELVEGGRLLRRLPVPVSSSPVPFEDIAALLQRYSWADEVEPGVFELSAALVQAPGTAMRVASPRVKAVRLLDRPGVFIGGRGATARFDGVTVTSWDTQRSMPDDNLDTPRPFVVYDESSRLEVATSHMSFLGSDRTSGYGVVWGKNSTGDVVDSTFDHNFFGVYASEAHDVAFRHSVFRDNLYYGLNVRTRSHNILADDSEAFGNGSHGFISAGATVDSVFRRNHAHDNKGNGIVMDGGSNHTVIQDNLVEGNAKDGIVVIASSDNLLADNVIRNHRVGVRINRTGSDRNVVRGNMIEGNQTGVHAYDGATETTVVDNTVAASGGVALLLDSPRSQVTGGHVRGAVRGMEIRAATRVTEVRVSAVDQGLVVTGTGSADVDSLSVTARTRPIQVQPGGTLKLERSTLGTPPAVKEPWMPLAGVAAVTLAVLLQALSHLRVRHRKVAEAPPGVWNTA